MLADERIDGREEELAAALLQLGDDQSVRVLEALAAVLANRVRRGWRLGDGAEEEAAPAGLHEPAAPWIAPDDPRLQLCRRVARRALRGSLVDPTNGATAFHRVDSDPDWARRRMPVAVFGPFLFYRG